MNRYTSSTEPGDDRGVVMYTQCDSCLTIFRITPRDLRTAYGRVCCCFCNRAFQALDSLTDVLPSALLAEATAPRPAEWEIETNPEGLALDGADTEVTPRETSIVSTERFAPPAVPEPELEAEAETPEESLVAVSAEPLAVDLVEHEPTFEPEGNLPEDTVWQVEAFYLDREQAEAESAVHRRGTALWSVGIGVLLATLLLQTAYATRAELARYPVARPLLEQMCAVVGCELPPRRAAERIHVVDRQVTVHPDAAEALLVHAYIDNQAEFAQPYPLLGLTFFDRSGQRAGQRWFKPDEYLVDPDAANSVMIPGQPVAVRLELMRPERGGDSYEFEFR